MSHRLVEMVEPHCWASDFDQNPARAANLGKGLFIRQTISNKQQSLVSVSFPTLCNPTLSCTWVCPNPTLLQIFPEKWKVWWAVQCNHKCSVKSYSNPQYYLAFYYRGPLLKFLIWQITPAANLLPSHSEIILYHTFQNSSTFVPYVICMWCTRVTLDMALSCLYFFDCKQSLIHSSFFFALMAPHIE